MMGLMPLEEELRKDPLSAGEDPVRRQEEGISPEPNHAGTLSLDFTASRSKRKKCLLSKPPSLWHFVKAAPSDSDGMVPENICLVHSVILTLTHVSQYRGISLHQDN